MANKRILGLVTIKTGDVAVDGGMGTSLTAIGDTVEDSALLETDDAEETDINIEEDDDPIEVIRKEGKKRFSWETYNLSGDVLVKLFGGIYRAVGAIFTLGAVTGGSAYTNGTYLDVPLTGGVGTGAKATVVVAGAVVTTVTITTPGSGYVAANTLSALAANIGGTGSGFAVPVATVDALATWEMPDSIPIVEQSIEVTDKKGNKIEIVRTQLAPKLTIGMTKTTLGKLAIVATILKPTKVGTKKMKLTYA